MLALLALVLSSCSPRGVDRPARDAQGRVVVTFWHGMGERTHQDLLAEFAAEYMREHPEVVIEPAFQGLYGTLYQKLIAAVTAGQPPAMAQMYESWTTRLLGRGRLDPVENHFDSGSGFTPDELSDFYPAFLENSRWQERLVTMPMNKSTYLLQYNADLLARAGWSRVPETWDEMREAARAVSQLTDENGQPCWGLLVRPQLEAFTTLFFAAGGDFLDVSGQPRMDSPEARESLAFIDLALRSDKTAIADTAYPASLLGSGRLGMYIHSSAAFPFNDRFAAGKFTWKAAPIPPPTRERAAARRTLFQGMNVGILADNPPEVRSAAWDFIKFMLAPERAARWSMQTGYCPVRRSILELPEYQAYLEKYPNYRAAIAEIEHVRFEPKPDFWESWRNDVGGEIMAAIMGLQSPERTLSAAQRDGFDALKYDSKFPELK